MADERVKVMHPNLPDTHTNPRELPRKNWEEHWQSRGWELWKPKKKNDKKEGDS